jgi:hypothetical protein
MALRPHRPADPGVTGRATEPAPRLPVLTVTMSWSCHGLGSAGRRLPPMAWLLKRQYLIPQAGLFGHAGPK